MLFKALKFPWKQLPLQVSTYAATKKNFTPNQLEFHKTVYNKKHHNFVFNIFALQQKEKRNHLGGEKKTDTKRRMKRKF